MDNAQKAIMIGVGLFITIIVIAAVMLITGLGQDLLNSGTQQLTGISESLRTQLFDQYDGKVLTGYQVKSACSDLLARKDAGITIYICDTITESHGTKTYSNSDGSAVAAIKSTDANAYNTAKSKISNNNARYTGDVSIDNNAGTINVAFKAN